MFFICHTGHSEVSRCNSISVAVMDSTSSPRTALRVSVHPERDEGHERLFLPVIARSESITNDAAISTGYFNTAILSIRERLLRLPTASSQRQL
jgi:hypothetical protein